MALTKREERVINAFLNCIYYGEYTIRYAVTIIEDDARYGWLSEEAKDEFYERLEKLYDVPEEEPVEPIPYEPPINPEPEIDPTEQPTVFDPEGNPIEVEAEEVAEEPTK